MPPLDRYIAILESLTATAPPPAQPRHQRGVYQPLRVYIDARISAGGVAAAHPLALEVQQAALQDGPLPAAEGSRIARLAWCALAAWGTGLLRDPMADFLVDLASRQQANGPFLLATRSDNPEPHWYHELILLHALATFSALAGDRIIAPAVARAAHFHLHETQPDHATTEPWAVHAFLRNPDTHPLAESLIHAAQAQHGGGLDHVSWMLLSDALYCLRNSSTESD